MADIQARVAEKLRLDATADATKMSEWVNQTLVDVAVRTKYFSGSSTGSALTAAASSASLPAAMVELEYMVATYGGQTTYMRPALFAELLMRRQAGGSASGPPQRYALRKDTVEFWPGAVGGETLTFYGATLPDEFTGSSSSGLPEPFNSNLLEAGACAQAAEFKADPRLDYFRAAYERWMGLFQAYLNRRKSLAAQAFSVYGGDAPLVPHDPSTDLYGWR